MFDMPKGYCIWEPRISNVFRRAVDRGVDEPELACLITGLFTRLWGNCIKSSRASLALRVFPDLTEEELGELALVDAYVNIMDDFIDLDSVDRVRGSGTRALYIRTILLVNTLVSSYEAKLFLGEIGAREVFDTEYRFRSYLSRESYPHMHSRLLSLIEKLYIGQAHDAWYFFAYPARHRLAENESAKLVKAGTMFRALWLLLDHLIDLDEDRRNNVVTGVRLAVDVVGDCNLLRVLVKKLNKNFGEAVAEVREIDYAANLRIEYERLRQTLEKTMKSFPTP